MALIMNSRSEIGHCGSFVLSRLMELLRQMNKRMYQGKRTRRAPSARLSPYCRQCAPLCRSWLPRSSLATCSITCYLLVSASLVLCSFLHSMVVCQSCPSLYFCCHKSVYQYQIQGYKELDRKPSYPNSEISICKWTKIAMPSAHPDVKWTDFLPFMQLG